MLVTIAKKIARGKPAEFDQEIVSCGNGAQTVQFSDINCAIDALDVHENQLTIFNEYIENNNLSNITTHHYDGGQIPFPAGVFDAVLSFEVLEHVENESNTLNEIHRVLKQDGELVISVPNKGWVFETHGARLPLLPWHRVPFFSWLPYSLHDRYARARIYRKRDIVKLLTAHGFIVNSAEYITAPLDVVNNEWLKKFLRSTIFTSDTTSFSILSTAILVHCKKGV
jgi:ubiquinone/menaquinone biosynthesis C-methylase UbiE